MEGTGSEIKSAANQTDAMEKFLGAVKWVRYNERLPEVYKLLLASFGARGFSKYLQKFNNKYTEDGMVGLLVDIMKAFFVGFETLEFSFSKYQTKRKSINHHWTHLKNPNKQNGTIPWFPSDKYPSFAMLTRPPKDLLVEIINAAYLKASDPLNEYRAFKRDFTTLFEVNVPGTEEAKKEREEAKQKSVS